MKFRLLYFLLLFYSNAGASILIDSVTRIGGSSIPKYGRFEVLIMSNLLTPSLGINPYDPGEVDMYAIFTSPGGKKYRRDAFWYREYSRCNTCTNPTTQGRSGSDSCGAFNEVPELYPPDPNAYLADQNTIFPWRVRFAPDTVGTWSYVVIAHLPGSGQRDTSAVQTFTVTSSNHKGYIYVDTVNRPRYFTYRNNGDLFIPIGLTSYRATYYDTLYNRSAMKVATSFIDKMAPYGGNLVRVIMEPYNFGIEWKSPTGSGLSNYEHRQRSAFDLDSVLTLAEQKGVYIQLTMGGPAELKDATMWADNPYNSTQFGGIVSDPLDYFTNAACKSAFKNTLRYTIARWGYSPNLFAYEVKGELDNVNSSAFWLPSLKDDIRSWYQEMVQFTKSKDSLHMHTISAASGGPGRFGFNGVGNPDYSLFGIPEVDFIQEHHYGVDYNIAFQRSYVAQNAQAYYPKKPMFFGELDVRWPEASTWIGANSYSSGSKHIYSEWHHALWSSLFSGTAGPGMKWTTEPLAYSAGCWGGQFSYFGPLKIFLQNETIFNDHPVAISNKCTGHAPLDEGRHYPGPPPPHNWDTIRNRCACNPVPYLLDSTLYPAFVTSGIITTNDSLIEVFALKTPNRVAGWIHNKQYFWYNMPRTAGGPDTALVLSNLSTVLLGPDHIPKLLNDSVAMQLVPGAYRLDFYSTWPELEIDPSSAGVESGGLLPGLTDTIFATCDGRVKFRIPPLVPITDTSAPFAPDYGFKLTWIGITPPRVLTSNTTWNTSSAISSSIIVSPGVTLNITNCTISMQPDSFIRVMPGGKLIVDNATLNSACDTAFWLGIQAVGNTHSSQTGANQATVEVKNGSVISEAKYAITNGLYPYKYDSCGGIIICTNSTFLNNQNSLQFLPYYSSKSISRIYKCTFNVDSNYIGAANNKYFDCHVNLQEIDGVTFRASKFYNHIPAPIDSNRRYGIISSDAGYSLNPVCANPSLPCGQFDGCEFKGFMYGVWADGSFGLSAPAITVDRATFDSNSVGIRVKGVGNVSVTRSNFYIGHGKTMEVIACFQNVGIYTSNAHSFRIEENYFRGFPMTIPLGPSGQTIGIATQTSTAENNSIYKNLFEFLSIGGAAIGENSSGSGSGIATGLRYLCNTFNGVANDILVSGDATKLGIARLQGVLDDTSPGIIALAGGNIFSSTGTNIQNDGHPITYGYDTAASNALPTVNSGSAVATTDAPANLCYSLLSDGGVKLNPNGASHLLASIENSRAGLADMVGEYYARLDGGDLQQLQEDIANAGYDQNAFDQLMEISPFLSEGMLRYLIDNSFFQPADLESLIVANPDVLRIVEFPDYLTTVSLYTQNVEDAMDDETERTELVNGISWYQLAIDQAYSFLITDVMNDSTATNPDSVIFSLLGQQQTLPAAYDIVGRLYYIGRLQSADSMMDAIPELYLLSDDEYITHNAYDTLLTILSELKAEEKQLTEMDLEAREILERIAAANSGTAIGELVAGVIDGVARKPKLDCASLLHVPARYTKFRTKTVIPRKQLNVYPNPARDFVKFSYLLTSASEGLSIEIINAMGSKVQELPLRNKVGIATWDTREVPAGVYIYQLRDSKQSYSAGKVVIVK